MHTFDQLQSKSSLAELSKEMLEPTTFIERKNPCVQIQLKEENWTKNTDIELLNFGHFKTKAKDSDENHATFISTSEHQLPFQTSSLIKTRHETLISLQPYYLLI